MSYLYNIESDSLDDGDSVFVPSKEQVKKVAEYDKLRKQIRDKIKFVPNAEKFLSLTAAPDSSAREDCARFSQSKKI